MTNSISLEELCRTIMAPKAGIIGLVEDLLATAREHGLLLNWKKGDCWVWLMDSDQESRAKVPLRKSVVRAILARVAVLCNQKSPNSVSPYGGRGTLMVGPADSAKPLQVTFVNTPDEQRLELNQVPDAGSKGGYVELATPEYSGNAANQLDAR